MDHEQGIASYVASTVLGHLMSKEDYMSEGKLLPTPGCCGGGTTTRIHPIDERFDIYATFSTLLECWAEPVYFEIYDAVDDVVVLGINIEEQHIDNLEEEPLIAVLPLLGKLFAKTPQPCPV